jgi:DNA-binding NarL/FixJ family response regulator
VLLADDHPVTRAPLRVWLNEEADIEVVGEAADGEEAVRLTRELRPDILLLDVWMPKLDGVAAAGVLRETAPTTRIVVLTGYASADHARMLTDLGVSGYLDKTTPLDQLTAALRLVHAGHTCLAPVAAPTLHAPMRPTTGGDLTPREVEVLRLVAADRHNAEIAAELCLSVKTVESHVSNALQKLEVRSRAAAVLRARDLGVL